MLILITGLTLAGDLLATFESLTQSAVSVRSRSEQSANTKIAAPLGLLVNATSTFQITLKNEGSVALGQFADWDVIFEILETSCLGIAYLTYTENASPGPNQWTVQGIYLDASSSTPEIVGPGVFNPGEEMIVLVNPDPSVAHKSYNRATFVTPNGITTKVILEALSTATTTLYVVDGTDAMVYKYEDGGPFLSTSTLDVLNANAEGITTDIHNFWASDVSDDLVYVYASNLSASSTWALAAANNSGEGLTTDGCSIWSVDHNGSKKAYKYTMSGGFDSDFLLTAANDHATGITTDRKNIWVVDHKDVVAYKYTLSGTLVSQFALTGGQTNPRGITTDGDNIWVVDHDQNKVYKYTMGGTFVSDFPLNAANADAEGITVTPR